MMRGSCLCGACTFVVTAPPDAASACHCTMCRKTSGHVWSSARVAETDIAIDGPVRWFEASDTARRGFCPDCGASMFWQGRGRDEISFALGCVDGDTGLRLEKHIFTADKGDYYDIADGLPQTP